MKPERPKYRSCSGTIESRELWWLKTNILRLRRARAHMEQMPQIPTLRQLERERSELEQMVMLNSILQELVTRLRPITRKAKVEKIDLSKRSLAQIAKEHNLSSSPFAKLS